MDSRTLVVSIAIPTFPLCNYHRVSVQGDKSLGSHFACLCQGFEFYEVRKKNVIIFQKEHGNTFTLFIIFIVKSLKKEQKAQIYYYAGINLQSPQSDSTPWTLTLEFLL